MKELNERLRVGHERHTLFEVITADRLTGELTSLDNRCTVGLERSVPVPDLAGIATRDEPRANTEIPPMGMETHPAPVIVQRR